MRYPVIPFTGKRGARDHGSINNGLIINIYIIVIYKLEEINKNFKKQIFTVKSPLVSIWKQALFCGKNGAEYTKCSSSSIEFEINVCYAK